MRHLTLLSLAALFGSCLPLIAQGAEPFAYRLVVTPEEGPVDPAVEARYTHSFDSCQKAAATTDQNIACFTAEFPRQDSALNKSWKDAMKRVPTSLHPALLGAQRKWIAERDPFCMKASQTDGTIGSIEYVSCRTELTIRRTMWLEELQ